MRTRILDGSMAEGMGGFPRVGIEAGATMAALSEAGLVRRLHGEFLRAGAEVIRTQTAALGRWRCNMEGLAGRFAEANRRACEAAVAARDDLGAAALVAGTLGPVRARYEPDFLPPPDVVERETVEQALLLAPHVDLFICETLTLGAEAAAMARAALSTGRPVWVAFTFHERGPLLTRGGESPAQAFAALEGLAVDAVLANCTSAETVGKAVAAFADVAGGIALGGYGHGFEALPEPFAQTSLAEEVGGRIEITPAAYATFARGWIADGASIVGGCCGIGPAHIAALKKLPEGR